MLHESEKTTTPEQLTYDVLSLYKAELEDLLKLWGQPRYRAGQLFEWLHKNMAVSFSEMTNLPKQLREKLDKECAIYFVKEKKRQISADGTTKFLFELHDKETIEAVLMPHDYGTSLCISSQVGCRMGCRFCASTIGGRVRNLSAGEMLSQIYEITKLTGSRPDSIVLMGIGEPLDNFDNLIRFLELIKDQDGFTLSHRHISVSTCGLVKQIDDLAALKYQLTLSVSLHACDNKTRSEIMPVNDAFPIEQLLESCKRYYKATGRRISYEHALIEGVNDRPEQAKKLAQLLAGQQCHVNLIPINPVKETGFKKTNVTNSARFRDIITENGVTATIRKKMGADIDAACGQLRISDVKGDHS